MSKFIKIETPLLLSKQYEQRRLNRKVSSVEQSTCTKDLQADTHEQMIDEPFMIDELVNK